jgi:hypothetical protein
MLRLVAMVLLEPGSDVEGAARRARAMLAEDPNVLEGEVGICEPALQDGSLAASYLLNAMFEDRAAFERYAVGEPHAALAAWIGPNIKQCYPVVYDVEQAKVTAAG